MKEAKSFLLSGVNAIYRNLPVEDVTIIDKHACISLSQKLDYAMAHGIDYHFIFEENGISGNRGINNCLVAVELEEWVKEYVKKRGKEVEKTEIG